jgi:hypothetical protein
MMPKRKIGRNDPCVCGSGKKYKKCCGSVDAVVLPEAAPIAEKVPTTKTINTAVSAMGVPGEPQGLVLFNVYKGGSTEPRNAGMNG